MMQKAKLHIQKQVDLAVQAFTNSALQKYSRPVK